MQAECPDGKLVKCLSICCLCNIVIAIYSNFHIFSEKSAPEFLARDVIYTSCAYATMSVSVCLSVCLSVTEVLWRIIANFGFKFRSHFTAHCGRAARRAACGRIISRYASQC